MDVPSPVASLLQPVVLRERWAVPRIAVNILVIGLVLVVPGTSALLLKPDNAGEGYAALLLAVVAVAWQIRRLRTAGIEIGPSGVRRLGRDLVPWATVQDLHWQTRKAVYRSASTYSLHWLRMTTSDGTSTLTRYPAKDTSADRFTAHLRELGVNVATPDWSTTPTPGSPRRSSPGQGSPRTGGPGR